MPRGQDAALGLFTAVALLPFTPSAATAAGTSVCVVAEEGCLAPGGIQVRLVLGQSDTVILGGQVIVKYDPQVLRLIEAQPGRACDPASPFSLELFDENDPTIGQQIGAFGISFLEVTPASTSFATLACFSFAHVGDAKVSTPVCLLQGLHPFETEFIDDAGDSVLIDNSQACPPDSPPPTLACDDVLVEVNCNCVPDTTDCHGLDTDCRTGVCNPITAHCEVLSVNEGGPCDDGDSCTLVDRCSDGTCVGEGCQDQSICASSPSCLGLDPSLTVKIRLSEGDHVIQGAQFSVQYDPSQLEFIGIAPGAHCDPDSLFTNPLKTRVDESAGEIFYAVGVGFGGPAGTQEPATLACLTFLQLGQSGADVCLFNDLPPFSTILVDENGRSVPTGNPHDCTSNREPPTPMCADFEPCIIPTVSEWGLVAMTLLLLTAAKVLFGYPRAAPLRASADRLRE